MYNVVESWDKIGKSGFKVCLFRLKKINFSNSEEIKKVKIGTLVKLKPNGLEPKWFSIGVDATNAQKLNSSSPFAQAILEKNIGEMIEFGNGFQILEVKKQNIEVEYLDKIPTTSGGFFVSIAIKDSTDILSLFYAGSYYALSKK